MLNIMILKKHFFVCVCVEIFHTMLTELDKEMVNV